MGKGIHRCFLWKGVSDLLVEETEKASWREVGGVGVLRARPVTQLVGEEAAACLPTEDSVC